MNLLLGPDDLAFRDEVRGFLEASMPHAMRRAIDLTTGFFVDPDVLKDLHSALHRKGWSVPHWPGEHGGTGWTPLQRYVFDVECGKAGAAIYNASGSHFVGPVIIRYGTQEQKEKYLPRIRSGEDYWAQGYSEPGSGSDLASLQTRAATDGDDYVVNGQKIWTTNAHKANRMFALVRTSSSGKRQEGITFLLIDMDRLRGALRSVLMPDDAERWLDVWERVTETVSRWAIGAATIAVIAGTVQGTTAWLLGSSYALALGIIAGLLDLIPNLGATIAGFILVPTILAEEGLTDAVIMLVVILVYQQLENNILSPTIYGKAVNISAFFVILGVTLFGALLGVLGALVAVPVTASLQIVVQEVTKARRATVSAARARLDAPAEDAPPAAPAS